jgi:hypothetical protein
MELLGAMARLRAAVQGTRRRSSMCGVGSWAPPGQCALRYWRCRPGMPYRLLVLPAYRPLQGPRAGL